MAKYAFSSLTSKLFREVFEVVDAFRAFLDYICILWPLMRGSVDLWRG